jgi:hypothetical protein
MATPFWVFLFFFFAPPGHRKKSEQEISLALLELEVSKVNGVWRGVCHNNCLFLESTAAAIFMLTSTDDAPPFSSLTDGDR